MNQVMKSKLIIIHPITVVSVLSKVIEILFKHYQKVWQQQVGFDKYQYGFIKNSGTLGATTHFLGHVTAKLNKIKYVIVVFINLA